MAAVPATGTRRPARRKQLVLDLFSPAGYPLTLRAGGAVAKRGTNAETASFEVRADTVDAERRRGRGARSNHTGRFEAERRQELDDGWEGLGDLDAFKTEVYEEPARTIITRNDSPDISFDRSINPYRGCEHGCIYCYARPSHCYLGHSAGLDFETKLYAKTNAAALLEAELAHPRYVPKVIA